VTLVLIVLLALALNGLTVALVCLWRALRDTVSAQVVRDVLDGVENPHDGLPPCRHPGCMLARTELWRLVGGTRAARRHARHSTP